MGDDDPRTRPLKKGDLVRVLERDKNGKKLSGLGRLVRITASDKDQGSSSQPPNQQNETILSSETSYQYDVEYVLGGKNNNLNRSDLVYTTATLEGLTEDSRPRRKRKPSNLVDNKTESDSASQKSDTKGKPQQKKGSKISKKEKNSTTTQSPTKKKGTGKKRARPGINSTSEEKSPVKQEDNESDSASLFLRHKKEFEKTLQRLERLDKFGFFFGSIPPELDDKPCRDNTDEKGGDEDIEKKEEKMFSSETPLYPNPPYNFVVIKKRMLQNRYILDRELQEQKRHERFLKQKSIQNLQANPQMNSINPETNSSILNDKGFRMDLSYNKMINWKLFHDDIISMCNAAMSRDPFPETSGPGTLGHTNRKIKELMESVYSKVGKKQVDEMDTEDVRIRLESLIAKNKEAAMQSTWRKEAFPERKYEKLPISNVVCSGLSTFEQNSAEYELETALPNCFVGIPYSYDDVGQSEDWMKSIGGVVQQNKDSLHKKKGKNLQSEEKLAATALAEDDGVVKAQVRVTMDMLLISVQDRVMTEKGVLNHPELMSANWGEDFEEENDQTKIDHDEKYLESTAELSEQSVWGIDCYTRKNVMHCLETHEEYKEYAELFVEKWLLPALNACPTEYAHNITYAAKMLEGEPISQPNSSHADVQISESLLGKMFAKKVRNGPPWLAGAARQLRLASIALGENAFRVHPKGHGAVVLKAGGIKANTMVTQYRGEVYPPWRWGEKMDAIEEVQEKFGLRPVLPDFYNMVLERPRIDPRGYGLLFVDASRKSGLGSLLSHSCSPTCHVHVAAVSGKLSLVMTTVRDVEQGEELTFDYNAVTESLNEYMSAVCLCGYKKCRSSFLHYATADCYQQVLARNAPIAVRLCSLIRAASKQVMSKEDEKVLHRHGFREAVFGAVSFLNKQTNEESENRPSVDESDSIEYVPVWLRTYVADVLRYIEYERRALPIALLCNHFKKKSPKTGSSSPTSRNSCSKNKEQSTAKKKKSSIKVENEVHPKDDVSNNTKESEKIMTKKHKSLSPSSTAQSIEKSEITNPSQQEESSSNATKLVSDKPIPGSRPQSSFLYYSKVKRQEFTQLFIERNGASSKGFELLRGVQRIASDAWKELSDEEKMKWKKEARRAWEDNGGLERAKLESERQNKLKHLKSLEKAASNAKKVPKKKLHIAKKKNSSNEADDSKKSKKCKNSAKRTIKTEESDEEPDTQISFQDADAEGRMLLEQRIQALTQALSRVGRVLARDRENQINLSIAHQASFNFKLHAPVSLMSQEKVVQWIWSSRDGLIQTLLQFASACSYMTPFLQKSLDTIVCSYEDLNLFCQNISKENESSDRKQLNEFQAKQLVTQALLDLRRLILSGISMADNDAKEHEKKVEDARRVELSRKRRISAMKGAATRKLKKLAQSESMFNKSIEKISVDRLEAIMEESTPKDTEQSNSHQHFDMSNLYASASESSSISSASPPHASGHGHSIFDSESSTSSSSKSFRERNAENETPNSEVRIKQENNSPDIISITKENIPGSIPFSKEEMNGIISAQNQSMEAFQQSSTSMSDNDTETSSHNIEYPSDVSSSTANDLSQSRKEVGLENIKANNNDTPHQDNELSKMSEFWASYQKNKYRLEATADLLLFYAHTDTFFEVEKYSEVLSTPIEVYARELGNEVPCDIMKSENESDCDKLSDYGRLYDDSELKGKSTGDGASYEETTDMIKPKPERQIQTGKKTEKKKKKKKVKRFCDPADAVASISRQYSGDYVFFQLLQWFNAGIGARSDIPDMLGCVVLPQISSCFSEKKTIVTHDAEDGTKETKMEPTNYSTEFRPMLVEWLMDRLARGNPWPDALKQFFSSLNHDGIDHKSTSSQMVLGSPVLDLLVTGDDSNISKIVHVLGKDVVTLYESKEDMVKDSNNVDNLESTVDEGMPVQAKINWVQCENPNCMKWRKLPFHVDIDILPDKFYCKDNIWNPQSNSCSAPEDVWDEEKDALIDGEHEISKGQIKKDNTAEYKINDRFDVMRMKNYKYIEGIIIETNINNKGKKRVKFHYPKQHKKFDEWIEVPSERIAPLGTYTSS